MLLWPGERMVEFFRALIRRETTLGPDETEKLAKACSGAINRMLVWEAPPARQPAETIPPVTADLVVAEPSDKAAPKQPPPPFDPFQFSVVVVLAKSGPDGLASRLQTVKRVEHLRQLAEAQHLGLEKGLKTLEELRRAIVASAERRIADRRAAAS